MAANTSHQRTFFEGEGGERSDVVVVTRYAVLVEGELHT